MDSKNDTDVNIVAVIIQKSVIFRNFNFYQVNNIRIMLKFVVI
jgi:hypothetical protein